MAKFVSEKIIDAVIEELDKISENKYDKLTEEFAEEQPVLTSYFFNSDSFDLLNEEEQGYLQYLALIVWVSNKKVNGACESVGEEQIGEAEEINYEILENSTAKNFRERLTPFFENYQQEDLLAFAEDAVSEEDPDSLITKEGREPIFVALKTLIDVIAIGE